MVPVGGVEVEAVEHAAVVPGEVLLIIAVRVPIIMSRHNISPYTDIPHDPPCLSVVAAVLLLALWAESADPVQAEGGARAEGEGEGGHQQPVQPLQPELPQTALC